MSHTSPEGHVLTLWGNNQTDIPVDVPHIAGILGACQKHKENKMCKADIKAGEKNHLKTTQAKLNCRGPF